VLVVSDCKVGTCYRPAVRRGYCHGHYRRLRKTGTTDGPTNAVTFDEKMSTYVEPTGFCWNWTGTTAGAGRYFYGRTSWKGKTYQAHRWVYEMLVGLIPDGLELDHLCRNILCVNPDHLEPVTPAENKRRSAKCYRGRDYCPKGHDLRPPRARDGRGSYVCRACKLAYFVEYNANRRTKEVVS